MLLEQPLDLMRFALDTPVHVRLKGGREVSGQLHAYDAHMNMVLGDAVEVRQVQQDDNSNSNNNGSIDDKKKREFQMLFVRGDSVILVSPHESAK